MSGGEEKEKLQQSEHADKVIAIVREVYNREMIDTFLNSYIT